MTGVTNFIDFMKKITTKITYLGEVISSTITIIQIQLIIKHCHRLKLMTILIK